MRATGFFATQCGSGNQSAHRDQACAPPAGKIKRAPAFNTLKNPLRCGSERGQGSLQSGPVAKDTNLVPHELANIGSAIGRSSAPSRQRQPGRRRGIEPVRRVSGEHGRASARPDRPRAANCSPICRPWRPLHGPHRPRGNTVSTARQTVTMPPMMWWEPECDGGEVRPGVDRRWRAGTLPTKKSIGRSKTGCPVRRARAPWRGPRDRRRELACRFIPRQNRSPSG